MAGQNHWANIELSREIMVPANVGRGDANFNLHLRRAAS
jgi:hypothetical protein